ncbi:SRPBCC family protein [Azospirillum sp.]|uniref:SRPBCC family protein n=1 Tax=Azospirillum sp. TaxID=34012 RepID=UPI002D51E41F|nr:SRPBCC family protein [Azospirillum sp.]HYD68378.1 SRPBCC family protein [Azospirillum sp.]
MSVPAGVAWAVLGDFEALATWHPAVVASPIEDGGPDDRIGCVRAVRLDGDAVIRERLLARCDDARCYQYALLDGPLPVRDYTATLRVVGTGSDSARIDWTARFTVPDDARPDEVATLMGEVFAAGLNAIPAHLCRPDPG